MDLYIGIGLALATALIWGTRDLLLRKAFFSATPFSGFYLTLMVTFFFSIAGIILFNEKSLWHELNANGVFFWTIVGVLQFPAAMACYYLGIRHVGASRTSVVSSCSVMLTPLIAMVMFNEPSTLQVIIGVLMTGTGVAAVSGLSMQSGGTNKWQLEAAYPLAAGLFWSASTLLTKFGFGMARLPMTALAISAGVSLVLTLPYLARRSGRLYSDLRASHYLGAGVLLSGMGQVTVFLALSFAATVYVVPAYNLKSLVTMSLAFGLIPRLEVPNWQVILGALLAIVGIALINIP